MTNGELSDLGHVSNLFLRHREWHSNNLLNHLLCDSLLGNHRGYVHGLLHLMRNKDVNIIFLFYMMVTLVIGDH